jgi:hypothetical protein
VRRFVDRQPTERPQLDNLGKAAIEPLESGQRVIKGQHRDFRYRGSRSDFPKRHPLRSIAPFRCRLSSRVVDENPSNDPRRHAKEVRPVLPINAPLFDEPQIRLVNERPWLQCVPGAFVTELTRGNSAQLVVDERQQAVEGASIAAVPVVEERRYVAT